MSPEEAVQLVAARLEKARRLPDRVLLTARGDEATEAVAEYLRGLGVEVVMQYLEGYSAWLEGREDTPQRRAEFMLLPKGGGVEFAFKVAGPQGLMSGGATSGGIGWAVLKTNGESGEDVL